jgi:hypothetical protein
MMQAILPLVATLLLSPEISVEHPYPTVGRATTIHVPEMVDQVIITYQPDAPAIQRVETILGGGTQDVVWRPQHPGVVRIEAAGVTKEVSVRFDGVPLSGVLIMLIAGTILLGGAIWSMRQLMSD